MLLELSELRQIVIDHVDIAGIAFDEILVILLGWVERGKRRDLGNYWPLKCVGLAHLPNIRLSYALLLLGGVEDGRPVLAAFVRPLPVGLSRAVRHGDIHL